MKEIITKAVIGKGKEETFENYFFETENNITIILGCWVINHSFKAIKSEDNDIEVSGGFDVNVWYAYDDNNVTKTNVMTKRVSYADKVKISGITSISDIIVSFLKEPSIIDTKIGKGKMMVRISKEFEVEVIDEVRVKIDEIGSDISNGKH